MERLHNGSSEKGWPKEDSKKTLSEEEHRQEGRPQEVSEKEIHQKAPLDPDGQNNKKAGSVPAFLFSASARHAQRE